VKGEETVIRPGETTVEPPEGADAALWFIGRIRTPWAHRKDCPKRGDVENGPLCRIEVDPRWEAALDGIEGKTRLQVLYWMDLARRDLVHQTPGRSDTPTGTFAIRSPNRPNPIASSTVRLVGREGCTLVVRGLDCRDGTPLIDIKPDVCAHA
jgi:tRNA-Thr(GGU) m(6)t(6)A37 methyltransferase TsaA